MTFLKNCLKDYHYHIVLKFSFSHFRSEGATLTVRSLHFLQLQPQDLDAFASVHKHAPLKRQTVITCLSTLKKSMAEEDAISCLVIGTENKNIFVLDPEAFTVLAMVSYTTGFLAHLLVCKTWLCVSSIHRPPPTRL